MTPQTFSYAEDGAVATITLNRPDRLNALTFGVYEELHATFVALQKNDAVRAVIVTGEGRGFCSGGDVEAIIGQLLERDMKGLLDFTRLTGALVLAIRTLRKPVIAAVNGIAAGAGAVIALACDFRIASEQASFAFLFTKVGLAGADMGAAWLLPRVVGLSHATELLMLGDRVKAADAHRLGLVSNVVPVDTLMSEARALAERLAAGPSFALGMTKELLNNEQSMDLASAIEAEAQAQAICMQTPAFRQAYEAFVAGRAPRFN
jgi:enoyl-CoA hydratase/carnithine racemase